MGEEREDRECMFPVAAEKNYHRLIGIKQQKLIPLQFWNPDVQNLCPVLQ